MNSSGASGANPDAPFLYLRGAMHESVRQAFIGYTRPLEGEVKWMYLDILGLVTVAYGNLIDPIQYATSLPFVTSTGAKATADHIAREWSAIKRSACGVYANPKSCAWPRMSASDGRPCLAHAGHVVARGCSSLRLTDDGVATVALRKLDSIAAAMRRRFSAFDGWPADAQLGVLSVAWACGENFRFPKLDAALRAMDWSSAERECTIREAGNPGVRPRNVENRKLMRNARISSSNGCDPSILYWPKCLASEQNAEAARIIHPDVPMGRPSLDDK